MTHSGPFQPRTFCDSVSSEQPGLVGYVPAHGRGVGTRWSLRPLPTQTILWFYDSIHFYLEKYLVWSKQTTNNKSHVLGVRKQQEGRRHTRKFFLRLFLKPVPDLCPQTWQKYLALEVVSTSTCGQMASQFFLAVTEHPGTKGSIRQTTSARCMAMLEDEYAKSSR